MNYPLVEIRNLKKYFPITGGILSKTIGYIKAVDGISLSIWKGETLGLVGESGCGKSTTGRVILRLIDATEGKVNFNGVDVMSLNRKELRVLRRHMQIIFQDPYSSLNPRKTIGDTLSEALKIHKLAKGKILKDRVAELLATVGLGTNYAGFYPHQISGGQRQRISIARALAVRPQFIVADEPVSSLDVSIQAQILNLLQDLQAQLQLTYLFVSHDLSIVRHISNRVAVMYQGRIVEIADSQTLYSRPQHPYTRELLSSVPIPDPRVKRLQIKQSGHLGNSTQARYGCPFHPRCPERDQICTQAVPELLEISLGHSVACTLRTNQ